MSLTAAIRELVETYEQVVRLEGRDAAEGFVATAIIAPPRVCRECGASVPLGVIHQHLPPPVERRALVWCRV